MAGQRGIVGLPGQRGERGFPGLPGPSVSNIMFTHSSNKQANFNFIIDSFVNNFVQLNYILYCVSEKIKSSPHNFQEPWNVF